MQNSGSIYGSGLDPEIMQILADTEPKREENPALIGIEEQRAQVNPRARKRNEQVVQTAAMDSKGHILHVGDKVVVGNDKSVGRIIALGRHATVSIPNEGTFEFPCSILELYGADEMDESMKESMNASYQKAYRDATMLLQPGGSKAYMATRAQEPENMPTHKARAGQAAYEEAHIKPGKDPKFESYDLTSMMKASLQEEDDFSDVADANARLMTMFEGQSFKMDLKQ